MWKPTHWKDDDVAEFRELMDGGPIEAVVIHAIYLINCASKDKEIRRKSIDSLIHSLRTGDRDRGRRAWCCTPARPSASRTTRR